jgi:hypothetical protein
LSIEAIALDNLCLNKWTPSIKFQNHLYHGTFLSYLFVVCLHTNRVASFNLMFTIMAIIQQIIFIAVLGIAAWLVFKRVGIIKKTILLGKDEDRTDQPGKRLSTMLRIAFGQKKMFDRPLIGILHFAVYAGFVLINIEILEIVLDGILGTHRLFAPLLGSFYPFLIGFFELLALGVMLACGIFLLRRSVVKVERLQPSRHREMNGWPQLDGKLILIFEIVLMFAILTMNAADSVLQDLGSVTLYEIRAILCQSCIETDFLRLE